MFITPSFKKGLIVEQFQGNYLKQNSTGYYELCECVNDIQLNSNIHNKQGCPLEVPGHRQLTLVFGWLEKKYFFHISIFLYLYAMYIVV